MPHDTPFENIEKSNMTHKEFVQIGPREAFLLVSNKEWDEDTFVEWYKAITLQAERDALYYNFI